jgi:hypothetical protein
VFVGFNHYRRLLDLFSVFEVPPPYVYCKGLFLFSNISRSPYAKTHRILCHNKEPSHLRILVPIYNQAQGDVTPLL